MTSVKLYKNPKLFSKFCIGLGMLMFSLGMISILTEFPLADWSGIFYVIQGVFFISFGTYTLRNRKYFIAWDENHLRFLMPGSKHTESIEFSDIQRVDIRLFEIILHLPDRTQKFDLNALDDDDLKKIKTKFKSFKKASD